MARGVEAEDTERETAGATDGAGTGALAVFETSEATAANADSWSLKGAAEEGEPCASTGEDAAGEEEAGKKLSSDSCRTQKLKNCSRPRFLS